MGVQYSSGSRDTPQNLGQLGNFQISNMPEYLIGWEKRRVLGIVVFVMATSDDDG